MRPASNRKNGNYPTDEPVVEIIHPKTARKGGGYLILRREGKVLFLG